MKELFEPEKPQVQNTGLGVTNTQYFYLYSEGVLLKSGVSDCYMSKYSGGTWTAKLFIEIFSYFMNNWQLFWRHPNSAVIVMQFWFLAITSK